MPLAIKRIHSELEESETLYSVIIITTRGSHWEVSRTDWLVLLQTSQKS